MIPTPGLLFQHIDVIMLTLDCDGMFTSLNPAAERCFACSSVELLGRPFSTVLDPFSAEKAAMMIARTLSEGGVRDWELDHLQPAGPPILVGYTTAALRDEVGVVVGIGAIGHDLSAKLELTAQLAQTNQQLEGALLQLEKSHAALKATQAQLVQSEKMRALGQMVAGVAHEINNPAAFVANNLAQLAQLAPALRALFDAYLPLKALASSSDRAVIAAAEAAAGLDYLWQDLPDLIQESQDGITRIGDIVSSLRNFSRLDEAALKAADINAGLRSTLQIIRPLCHQGIVIVEAYGDLPSVLCRPGELNQVFLNLLTNAMQAIDGAGQIWVASVHEQDRITVTIRDSGGGMDAATQARLGEPFFTTKPVGAGTGLGLAVSLGIVERHGGRLRFESAPGSGTSAIVEIPLKPAEGD
jgi:PAS domain S-box-containing protein